MKLKFRSYTIDPKAVAMARALGLFGDTEKRLARMARRASAVTSEHGNWRFFDYFLTIEAERVVGVVRL